MAAEEKQHAGDRKQIVLIGYLAICVVMIVATLILAFTPEEQAVQQERVISPPTRTLSPFQLTAQADYATVVPGQSGNAQEASAGTPTPSGGQS
ncbi:MAG: hypothetical protein IPK19_38970 [Chloroflexi bacterium]|nr:hypothetical protein [Chloroflexota bacterium]